MTRRETHRQTVFPQAPSQEDWDAMTDAQRDAVVDSLPNTVTDAEMSPPEGDQHFKAKIRALDAISGFFQRQGKSIYLACELPVYYPRTPRFAPDLLAVRDVDPHERSKWVCSAEGRGLEFVLEVHFGGDRKKDAERNVELYARLRIPEYFIYDRKALRLYGYRLRSADARQYSRLVPQEGRFKSEVLGLELGIEDERLRFYFASAPLPQSDELISRLGHLVSQMEGRFDEEVRLRKEETRLRKEAEKALRHAERAAKSAMARAEKAEAELAALRKKTK